MNSLAHHMRAPEILEVIPDHELVEVARLRGMTIEEAWADEFATFAFWLDWEGRPKPPPPSKNFQDRMDSAHSNISPP